MYKFKIGNANLAYNFGDADKMLAYENALKYMSETFTNQPKDISYSERIRFLCTGVITGLDELFGSGTSEKVFCGVLDISKAFEALEQLIVAQRAADGALGKEILKIKSFVEVGTKK